MPIRFPAAVAALALASLVTVLSSGSTTAGPTSTTLSGPQTRTTYGETAAFTARVAGSDATGNVTLKAGTAVLGTGTLARADVAPSLSAGGDHACALTTTGGVQCWGRNDHGQLGNGTTTDSDTPVSVSGLASGVVAVAVGADHTCALTEDGSVKCWGGNGTGQLGDGTTTDRHSPVAVTGLPPDITTVTANGLHSCARTGDGAALCWGWNAYGQLGDGSTTNRHAPVAVTGLGTGTATLSGGLHHTCTATGGGAAKCWGYNANGQLGDGTTTDRHSPVAVTGLGTGAAEISTGNYFTCALAGSGGVKCWGYNSTGQLGNGTTTPRHTPDTVTGLGTGVAAIASSRYHSCALIDDGSIQCWGRNTYGQIGDGTTANRAKPVGVSDFSAGAALIAAEATVYTSKLSAGKHRIRAAYEGDAGNDASTSSSLTHKVRKGPHQGQTDQDRAGKAEGGHARPGHAEGQGRLAGPGQAERQGARQGRKDEARQVQGRLRQGRLQAAEAQEGLAQAEIRLQRPQELEEELPQEEGSRPAVGRRPHLDLSSRRTVLTRSSPPRLNVLRRT